MEERIVDGQVTQAMEETPAPTDAAQNMEQTAQPPSEQTAGPVQPEETPLESVLPSVEETAQAAGTEAVVTPSPNPTEVPGERWFELYGKQVAIAAAAVVLVIIIVVAAVCLLRPKKKRKPARRKDAETVSRTEAGDDDMDTAAGVAVVGRVDIDDDDDVSDSGRTVTQVSNDKETMTEDSRATTPVEKQPEKLPEEVPSTELVGSPTKHPHFDIGRAATIGGRKEQQDSLYCSNWRDDAVLNQRGLMVAVADGIGGLADGSLASTTAMRAIMNSFVQGVFSSRGSKKLLSLVAAAQRDVLNLNQSGHQCGCTLVGVLIENWDLYLASVGDSRIYLYRGGGLLVLNRAHTLQVENEERIAVAQEDVPPETLRRGKAITSYLGKANLRLIDRTVHPLRLLPGDKIALMSDGIFGTLDENEIAAALRKKPEEAARAMVASIDARHDPRQDNATVVVIAVE